MDASAADMAIPPTGPRTAIDLGSAWQFHLGDVAGAEAIGFDDSSWSTVALPHTWNNLDGQMGGNAYYPGIGWYRRHIAIDALQAGRRFFVEFDGANLVTDVYVNGQSVGEHKGGYARFRFDVTSYLTVGGDNVIAVKVNNAFNADIPPLNADYTFFGGLYRGVRLVVTDAVHIAMLDYASPGVYLQASAVSAASAMLQITTKAQNDTAAAQPVALTTHIKDANGQEVATLSAQQQLAAGAEYDFVQTTTLATPHLWNGQADPYLYTVTVELNAGAFADSVGQPLGIRTYSVDPNLGFMLNGNYLDLHGVNRHQDRLDKGWAIGDAEQEEDFALIQEIGATAIRACHYQHAQHFYDLADRHGMVVWAEIPLIDYITVSAAFTDNAKQQLIELVRQNYNHPSIFFWSISNELVLKPGPPPGALQDQLGALAKAEDPTRLSTLASTDAASDLGHTNLIGFNKYFGWYYGAVTDFGGWADQKHASTPMTPFAVSEFGAGASILFHSDTPTAMDHTEEYQALLHEGHWRAMRSRPYLWGKFVWNMFDFASASRNEGDTPGRNDKGLVTYDRKTRKDAFYYYKANWTKAPFVYITSRRFTPRTQAATLIKVYGIADSVEVKLNGNSLGKKSGVNGVFSWPQVTLIKGQNTVEAIGTAGAMTVNDSVVWTLN